MYVGKRYEIFWSSESAWFPCEVTSISENYVSVTYDDGDVEDVPVGDFDDSKIVRDEVLGSNNYEGGGEVEDEGAWERSEREREEEIGEEGEVGEEPPLLPSRAEEITKSLQEALDEIQIKSYRQEQDDQEAWLEDFLKGMDNGEVGESAHCAASEGIQGLGEEGGGGVRVEGTNETNRYEKVFDNEVTVNEIEIESEAKQRQNVAKSSSKTRNVCVFNSEPDHIAGSQWDGSALLQGSVTSLRLLRKDPLYSTSAFCKVLYSSSTTSTKSSKNSLFACKSTIHSTGISTDQGSSHVFTEPSFSVEIVPSIDSNGEWDVQGEIIFAVYEARGGGNEFLGQATVGMRDIFNGDEGKLEMVKAREDADDDNDEVTPSVNGKRSSARSEVRVPSAGEINLPLSFSEWLPLVTRSGKPLGYGSEVHVDMKLYLPKLCNQGGDARAGSKSRVELGHVEKPMKRQKGEKVGARKGGKKGKKRSEYAQQKSSYTYEPYNAKERIFRDRLIRIENARLQTRIDKLRPAGINDADRPFDVRLQDEKKRRKEVRKKERMEGSGGVEVGNKQRYVGKDALEIDDNDESAKKYLMHVELAELCETEARKVAQLREERDRLKSQVQRVEQQRKAESRTVASLLNYLTKHSRKREETEEKAAAAEERRKIKVPTETFDVLEVTPEAIDIRKAHVKLQDRRSKAMDRINGARARREIASKELSEVSRQLELAKQRYNDPEADGQLASAHREVSRLRTDVETLKHEALLGYAFQKRDETDIIIMNDEVEALRGKEERKRKKIFDCTFERDKAREEYKAWLSLESSKEIENAAKVLSNAIKIFDKMNLIKIRAINGEHMDSIRDRVKI